MFEASRLNFGSHSGKQVQLPSTAKQLFEWVEEDANAKIEWYRKKKRMWQRLSISLRVGAAIFLIVGSLCPLLASATGRDLKDWGYVSLAVSAGVVVIDRIVGASHTWARLMRTALELEALRDRMRLKWARLLQEASPSFDEAVELARVQLVGERQLVAAETATWANDLQASLELLAHRKGG